jgi:aquaporin Z
VLKALKSHYPEYLMEAVALALFMISASCFTTLLEHPESPLRQAIPHPLLRRVFMGLAMGCTAVSIIYSPWGRRSGAHMNPSVTLTFFRLGKVEPFDALFYVLAQFTGGIVGVQIASALLGSALAVRQVRYAATVPGPQGAPVAFLAEVGISFLLMLMVLTASNNTRWAPFTGLFAGALVASYITLEAPISGMSMNPARTFGSAVAAKLWTNLWIYFTAPPLGMMLASAAYLTVRRSHRVRCAKLVHSGAERCIFRCGYMAQAAPASNVAVPITQAVQPIPGRV